MTEALDKWRSRLETVMSETLIYYWINEKPRYGKELISLTQSTISEKIKIPTVYAILNRGKSQGLLIDFVKPDKDKITRGKERKYYQLTEEGKEYYHQLKLYLENAKYMHGLFQSEVITSLQSEIEVNQSPHNDLESKKSIKPITQDSLSKQDFIILGYLNLHERTTYKVICEDLDIEYEEVLRSIMVLSSFFEINSEDESHHEERSVFLNLKQKQFDLLNLIFNKVDKSLYDKIEGMRFEDILNMKLIAGILVLKQEIRGISSLLKYFKDKEIPILAKLRFETLLQYIGLISLNKYLQVQITSEGWIITNKHDQTPIFEENTILPGYHWLNYNELIGWLSTIRVANLLDIKNRINKQGVLDFNINEVLLVLAILVTDGVLDGYIEDDSTLHIINVNKNSRDSYLSKNERILLGFIKSYNRKKLEELALILDVDLEEVSRLMFQVMRRSGISFEIARDGSIITRNLEQLPVQIQPVLLNIQLQELYGYLSIGQSLKISELEVIWEKSIREIKADIFELVGYGLIECKVDKNKIIIISKQKSRISIAVKLTENQKTLIDELEKLSTDRIKISEISNIVGKNINELIKEISILTTLGVYPDAYFENNYFINKGLAKLKFQIAACENCGTKMQPFENICINCEKERWFCVVCRSLIAGNESIRSCPFCTQKGHKDHFTNWLQIREECPSCRSNIKVNQLEGTG
ncbi:MAG: hypothetical protein GPJ54_02475 [Candidatus Heimdallarchaeota archaeon]|nr:hypothetical protein [Candidatus Heimdallarchaeota archaeon]